MPNRVKAGLGGMAREGCGGMRGLATIPWLWR